VPAATRLRIAAGLTVLALRSGGNGRRGARAVITPAPGNLSAAATAASIGATLLLGIAGQRSASGWYRASDPHTEVLASAQGSASPRSTAQPRTAWAPGGLWAP